MQKRNVVCVLGFLSLLAVAVRAAGQTPQAESPIPAPLVSKQAQSPTKARVDTLLKGIALSAEQQPRVDSIIAIYVDQLPATLPVASADSLGRERFVALLDRLDTEVRMVLTPEQQTVFDKNKEEWRRRAGVRST
jgi:Na+-transporting methylmalonyl-CoA/oxaloacetate decarboxylase gamma subunit